MNYNRFKQVVKKCRAFVASFCLIIIFMMSGIQCPKVYAANTAGSWKDYIEEPKLEGSTYKITKPEQLAWVFKNMNADMYGNTMFRGKIIELENDIDLYSHYWFTAGSLDATFNGNNHVIKNVSIGSVNQPCTDTVAALISKVSGNGIVENLGIEDIFISAAGNMYAGGIAGDNSGMIKNCYITSFLFSTISGTGMDSMMFNCYTGGIVGYNESSGCIQDCYAYHANVVGSKTSQSVYCGGIVGDTRGTIRNCYFIGIVDATLVGGITGKIEGGSIVNCYSDVLAMGLEDGTPGHFRSHGGIAGDKTGGSVSNCYYNIEESIGTSFVLVKEGTEMKLKDMQNPAVSGATVSFADTLNANVPSGCTRWRFVNEVNSNLPLFEAVQAPIFIKNVQPQYKAHSIINIEPQISGGSGNGEVTYSYSGRGSTVYGPSSTQPEKVGTYTVTATKAKDDTYAAIAAAYDFEIIVNSSIYTIDSITAQTYTSANITPDPVVKDGTAILTRDKDYTVSYLNNFYVGKAKVSIQGIGSYEGCSGSAEFEIKPVATLSKVLEKSISAGYQEGTTDDPKLVSIKVESTVGSVSEADIKASDAAAEITFYGTDDTFTTTSAGISLPGGKALDIYIKVTSQGGNVALFYRVTVRRAAPILITGITVSGAGDAAAITSKGGTLQMEAAVTPNDATDKAVKWSITSGDNFANISSTGLLTAKDNGTVTVRAAAKNDSNVYGEKIIDISGQAAPVVGQTLIGITTPSAITVANGTAKTAEAFGLPIAVELVTDGGNVSADVNWDVDASPYNVSTTTAQAFTINGIVTLPADVVNTNNLPLTTSINVTVNAANSEEPTVDTSSIDSALAAANTARSGVTISTNGTDIAKNVYWVTKEQMAALTDAINIANTSKAAVKTTAEAQKAANALNTAVNVFNSQKAYGSYSSSNNGGDSGSSGNSSSSTSSTNPSPVSEYVKAQSIVEKPKEIAVDLTGGSAKTSLTQMKTLIEENKEKPVVLSGKEYTITFEPNTMKVVAGKTAYDFGVSFNSGSNYSKIKELSNSSFAREVSYNYSGKLPAEAAIKIKLGTQYAGKILYYYYYNSEKGTLEYIQSAEVDKDGYAVVKQSHCSDYVFLSKKLTGIEKTVERFSGSTRVDTSIKIAKAAFEGKLSAVILVTAENYPDSLAAGVLAYKLNAPILLVGSSDSEQEKVLSYMKDNMDGAGTVYILGGIGAVSKEAEAKITDRGFKNIERIEGTDRYETAVKIAETAQVTKGTPIILVYGESYADALSVSSIAAVNQYPILMVKGNEIPDAVKKEIAKINPDKVYIIGLQGAISTEVENEIQKLTSLDKANIVRIGGENRFETSINIAKYFALKGNAACIATGNNFPDALAGSIYAAKKNASIILIDKVLNDSETTFLESKKLECITIFGGESTVSKDAYEQLSNMLGQ